MINKETKPVLCTNESFDKFKFHHHILKTKQLKMSLHLLLIVIDFLQYCILSNAQTNMITYKKILIGTYIIIKKIILAAILKVL